MTGMDLSWLDPNALDERDLNGAAAVWEAARAVDTPQFNEETVTYHRTRLRHGWDGEPPLVAVTKDGSGRVIGVLSINLPRRDNTHLATLQVVVDPVLRGRGIGKALFEAGLARIREEGRRVATSTAFDPSPGMAFLKAQGFDPVLELAYRRQDLTKLDWDRLDQLFAEAQAKAANYELVRMPWPVPEELLPAVAELTAAINDAPTDDLEFEDEVFDAERIRAYEAAQDAHGRRVYRLVARERSTGELAGHTIVGVSSEKPWYGGQHDTSVAAAHRGHRLGLLLKIGMLRWLREVEPQLRSIETDNAASNTHMIRVNELIGYELIAKSVEFQRRL
ncbi:MAG TPA: GNAT family N-acetyltransferase [Natronosporangium sp.]